MNKTDKEVTQKLRSLAKEYVDNVDAASPVSYITDRETFIQKLEQLNTKQQESLEKNGCYAPTESDLALFKQLEQFVNQVNEKNTKSNFDDQVLALNALLNPIDENYDDDQDVSGETSSSSDTE